MTEIPPLTDEWLRRYHACDDGLQRFHFAAPNGRLVMDDYGAAMLARFCTGSDLSWLLRKIITFWGAIDVRLIAHRYAEDREKEYRRIMAAACVAAWREYHR